MTPDAYAWPTDDAARERARAKFNDEVRREQLRTLTAENTRLQARITDLEHQANTLAAALLYALTDPPNREPNSQRETA